MFCVQERHSFRSPAIFWVLRIAYTTASLKKLLAQGQGKDKGLVVQYLRMS